MTEAHVSDDDITRHLAQLSELEKSVRAAIQDAARAVDRVLTEARSVRAADQGRVSRLEADRPQGDSSRSRGIDEARSTLDQSSSAIRILEVALGRTRSTGNALERLVTDHSTRGRSFLRERLDPTTNYLRPATANALGDVAISGAPSSAAPASAGRSSRRAVEGAVPGHPHIVMVPLSLIDDSDSRVTSDASFEKASADDLRWALDALEYVVLPAVRQGASAESFSARDATTGNNGDRSYRATYSGFLSPNGQGIKLSARADGRYEIVNGFHRVWLAREAGVEQLPVSITRSAS